MRQIYVLRHEGMNSRPKSECSSIDRIDNTWTLQQPRNAPVRQKPFPDNHHKALSAWANISHVDPSVGWLSGPLIGVCLSHTCYRYTIIPLFWFSTYISVWLKC